MAKETILERAGTELKLNVSIEPINGEVHMDDMDFVCAFYKKEYGVEYPDESYDVRKLDMVRVDEDNYVAVVDTAVFGAGEVLCRLTAFVPDTDCPDGTRTEVITLPTGVTMY